MASAGTISVGVVFTTHSFEGRLRCGSYCPLQYMGQEYSPNVIGLREMEHSYYQNGILILSK